MTIGELLQAAFDHLYSLWPVRIVSEWEQGARLFAGKVTRTLHHDDGLFKTGIHFFWPLLGEIHVNDASLDVLELDWQTVRLQSGEEATFSLGVKWRIKDLGVLLSKINQVDNSLSEAMRSGAGVAARQCESIDHLALNLADLALRSVRAEVRGWGVDVVSVRLISVTLATPIRLISDGGVK